MASHQVQMLFVDLSLILILGRALGAASRRFGQPPVVGEIVAGVLLGPTLFHGALAAHVVPRDVRPLLTAMADVGVVLFMFCVGLELETGALKAGRTALVVRVAAAATVLPFALGVAVAVPVLRGHAGGESAGSVLFVGLSLSVTAFPVLARILADRSLLSTPLGGIALSSAAVVDVVAWIGLAVLQAGFAGSGGSWGLVLMIPFTAAMFAVVRPVLAQVFLAAAGSRSPHAPQAVFIVVVVGALLAGAATEAMGMQFIFGAFLFGAAVPRGGIGAAGLREFLRERAGQVTAVFLPVYFVVAGLNVDLGRLSGGDMARLGLINVVAVAGKFSGTLAAARWHAAVPRRDATALALLMNTRGLTEMVILGIGLQVGLIDDTVYSLMVAMAVLTTAAAGPLLSRVKPRPVLVGSVSAVSPRIQPRRVEQADGLLVHSGRER